MARDHARVQTAIWCDPDWTALGSEAQRAYVLAISQQDMSYAGVVPYRPRRWAAFAKRTSAGGIRRAVEELRAAGFVFVDEGTEELLVRSFVRHDNVLRVPNVTRAMIRAWHTIASHHLRDVVVAELAREYLTTAPEDRGKGWSVLTDPAAAGGMREVLDAALADRQEHDP